MNNWVKSFRIKDSIDRISLACQDDNKYFTILFNWLMMHSLNGNNEETWTIEDFRKISLLLSININDSQVEEFFTICVDKFGI